MSEPTAVSWSCPSCGRRVPLRADVCYCGMTRERAAQVGTSPTVPRPLVRPATTRRAAALLLWRSFPADIKAFTVAAALVLLSGLGWMLFGPGQPDAAPPLLGFVDNMPPPPPPTPKPGPPFKLPWWR